MTKLNGTTGRLARARARAIELGKQVPPLTTFKIAELIRAEFDSKWPTSTRVHEWFVEARLDGVSRVGKMPRSFDKEAVLAVIRTDRDAFERTGRPKYPNLERLAEAIGGISPTTLANQYRDALAYRRLRTSKWPHGSRSKPTRHKAEDEWGG